jgi:hypothetical protein
MEVAASTAEEAVFALGAEAFTLVASVSAETYSVGAGSAFSGRMSTATIPTIMMVTTRAAVI